LWEARRGAPSPATREASALAMEPLRRPPEREGSTSGEGREMQERPEGGDKLWVFVLPLLFFSNYILVPIIYIPSLFNP
jgi:hypothetical protein